MRPKNINLISAADALRSELAQTHDAGEIKQLTTAITVIECVALARDRARLRQPEPTPAEAA